MELVGSSFHTDSDLLTTSGTQGPSMPSDLEAMEENVGKSRREVDEFHLDERV